MFDQEELEFSAPAHKNNFLKFHRENPQVLMSLLRLAGKLRDRGHTRYSIKGLFEVLRWRHSIKTKDSLSSFKLCNNHTAFYARLIMDENQDLATCHHGEGFFKLKKQTCMGE